MNQSALKCLLAIALFLLVLAPDLAVAQELKQQSEQQPRELPEEIMVTADRIGDFNGNRVTEMEGAQLISAEYIRAQQATTLADALRKTTSVQVDESGGNQGALIIVRGLQGDQVSVRVDGAPQNFNQVRHGGANTIWAEPDMYKSITVIPGIASNVYGNGSIGGVVKLETRDPSDVLAGEGWGVNLRLGHESNGDARYLSSETAYQFGDDLAGLLHVVSRDSGSYVDGNGDETLGGATGSEDLNLLGKLTFSPAPAHNFALSRRTLNKDYVARGARSRGREVSGTDQFTAVADNSTALQYGFAPQDNQLINANLRYSRMESERERSAAGSSTVDLWGSETDYFEVENTALLNGGGAVSHEVRIGADFTRDDLITAYTNSAGDKLLRERRIAGVYISDTIALTPSLLLIASARYDRYEASDLSSGAASDSSTVSPRLHVNFSPFDSGAAAGLSFYGLVGRGFRAPSVHENFGRGDSGVICSQGRRGFACNERVPNPVLAAEISESREVGIRYNFDGLFTATDQLRVQMGYVNNDVADFIDRADLEPGEIVVNDRRTRVERTTFVNIHNARIDGWEYFVNYAGSRWFASLTAQTMDGHDVETGMNLRDVSPHSVNASLGFYLADGRVRAGIDMTRRGDREVDADSSFNRLGYTVYDLFASYRFNDRLSLQLRVENALDELYTKRYQSLSIDPATQLEQDLTYYQPGRNIKATLEFRL